MIQLRTQCSELGNITNSRCLLWSYRTTVSSFHTHELNPGFVSLPNANTCAELSMAHCTDGEEQLAVVAVLIEKDTAWPRM
jgi:hypothetical protein